MFWFILSHGVVSVGFFVYKCNLFNLKSYNECTPKHKTMDTFHIDRQFGQPIWIDVVKGIVKRCYNETQRFNRKMNEIYRGKTITFLKEDFELRMKPVYHNVRPTAWTDALQKVIAVQSKLRAININLSRYEISAELRKQLEAMREELIKEESKYEREVKEVKERLLTEHNYRLA